MSETKDKKPSSAVLNKSELEDMRALLLQRRMSVTQSQATQLSEMSDPNSRNHLADLEEISDSSNVDSFCEIMDIHGATVSQIDAALEKINAGTYGSCEECGEAIPRPRLEALPFAGLCVDCQRAKELEPRIDEE